MKPESGFEYRQGCSLPAIMAEADMDVSASKLGKQSVGFAV